MAVALLDPTLVGVTRPLHLLSSTALLSIAVAMWIGTWFGLELAWEWRAGRVPVDASSSPPFPGRIGSVGRGGPIPWDDAPSARSAALLSLGVPVTDGGDDETLPPRSPV